VSDETRDRPGGTEAGGEEREPARAPEAPAGSETPAEREAAAADEAAARAKAAAAAKAKAEAAAKAKAAHEAAEAAKQPWERDPVAPQWEAADDDPLVGSLRERHAESLDSARTLAGDLTLEVKREAIADIARSLKDEGFLLLVDICGAHYPDRDSGRYEVVYHLYSFAANRRIRVKLRTDEGEEVPSVTSVWVGANWPEREAWDMFGIRFSGHPDMTRILLWEGFNGHPLRKDFPVEGIDTGSAIYPEYYEDDAGPVAGTGTGWKPPEPPEAPAPEPDTTESAEDA
jgi:NADH-quinone oxidoreductase subunit C